MSFVINNMNKSNIKAAVIEPVGGHGGMNYYDFCLCESIRNAGLDISLFTCDETDITPDIKLQVNKPYKKIFGIDSPIIRAVRYVLGSTKALVRCVLERRSIVHFHWFHVGLLELFNIVLSKLLFRKIVITAHDVEAFATGLSVPAFVRTAYGLCDVVVAHNKVSAEELVQKVGVLPGRINIIPHGNYLDVIDEPPAADECRKKLNISEESKVLLFFGQIKDVKGLDILLEAMSTIIDSCPNVLLVIAGKVWKTDFSKYDELIDRYNIRNSCLLNISYIPDSEVSYYYGAADLLVLPYRRIYQSGVLLMAMSFGKAVVVSDLPGMLEIIDDRETGLVFESENVNALSATIISAFNNPELLKRIAKNGKLLMQNEYDWKIIGESTAALYAQLFQ